jgi:hypothetical protein
MNLVKYEFIKDSTKNGIEFGFVKLHLDDGTVLALDQDGIMMASDRDKAASATPEQPYLFGYASWEEIMAIINQFRAEAMN